MNDVNDQFISIISHELRTPLSAIKGLASMMLKGDYGEVSDRLRKPLIDIFTSAERQLHLIKNLLDSSQLQTGRMKYALTAFSLQKTIEEVVAFLETSAIKKKITLRIEQGEEAFVQGDIAWIKEILECLIANAIKFTEKGGIIVSCRLQGDGVVVAVADTGAGIPPDKQRGLFDTVEQLGAMRDLSIAREVARKIGGDVRLEKSFPGQGSTFILVLPKADTSRARAIKIELEKTGELALNNKEGGQEKDNKDSANY